MIAKSGRKNQLSGDKRKNEWAPLARSGMKIYPGFFREIWLNFCYSILDYSLSERENGRDPAA